MKIIDNTGRIFGRLNIIDAMVLLFLLCLTPMFYFGYKIMTREEKTELTSQTPQMEYDILRAQVNEFLKEHKRAEKYFERTRE